MNFIIILLFLFINFFKKTIFCDFKKNSNLNNQFKTFISSQKPKIPTLNINNLIKNNSITHLKLITPHHKVDNKNNQYHEQKNFFISQTPRPSKIQIFSNKIDKTTQTENICAKNASTQIFFNQNSINPTKNPFSQNLSINKKPKNQNLKYNRTKKLSITNLSLLTKKSFAEENLSANFFKELKNKKKKIHMKKYFKLQ